MPVIGYGSGSKFFYNATYQMLDPYTFSLKAVVVGIPILNVEAI